MRDVFITHIGAFLPNQAVANDEMEAVLGISGERPSRARRLVLRSNGISRRHYAIDPHSGSPTHTNAQLSSAAIAAMLDQDFTRKDIQSLACGTSIPDQIMPGHAVMVHAELGAPPCEVVSLSGVCVAGVTALKYAYLGVGSGDVDKAVASGSELVSTILRGRFFSAELQGVAGNLKRSPELAFEKDFLRWMLSDGAGAVALQSRPHPVGPSLKIEWIVERSYASEFDTCMYCGAVKQDDGSLRGWTVQEPQDWLRQSTFSVKQDVKLLNDNIVEQTLLRPLREIIPWKKLSAGDIDYFLPHYSSNYFREKVFDGLQSLDFGIPYERWFTNLSTRGNTGSASIYIMLEELFHSGRLVPGQKILCYVPESGRFSAAFILLTSV